MERHCDYVAGIDFGTDSVRCLVVNASNGTEVALAMEHYGRWKTGALCDPTQSRYRQHPLDYIESLETVVRRALDKCGAVVAAQVRAISFDTTASTPVLIDKTGTPLSLSATHTDNPDASFMLWKDHTAQAEADLINELAHNWTTDYTRFSGGTYSCEWAWAKVLHALRSSPQLRTDAAGWVEHCDWISGVLTGNTHPATMMRSRCAAGHKAMWHASWGGLPSEEFLAALDPLLPAMITGRYTTNTHPNGACAGELTAEWSGRLGLSPGVRVGLGAIDCHVGAIGAGITEGVLVKTIGTSTCDILSVRPQVIGSREIPGICGQVDGSVLPGYVGLEAGQSAFGDVYAWFRDILAWSGTIPSEEILPRLSEAAVRIEPTESAPVALDWLNGRRTPHVDSRMRGAIEGITLATTAPMLFRTLVEATAFGSRAINDHFTREGIYIDDVIAIGGIAARSPLVMQIMADVGGVPIRVAAGSQTCALGAAMCAAVAGGIHPTIEAAQKAMSCGFAATYQPNPARTSIYDTLYARYLTLGSDVTKVHQTR